VGTRVLIEVTHAESEKGVLAMVRDTDRTWRIKNADTMTGADAMVGVALDYVALSKTGSMVTLVEYGTAMLISSRFACAVT
jgi:uncharacterized protein YbjQ (UPF0145 family)